jgi:cytochrome b
MEHHRSSAAPLRSVPVWDAPTRIFHWLLATAVLLAYFVEPERGWQFVAHVSAGCTALALVIFRLSWGFIGSAHSRFTDFVHGLSPAAAYARQLLRLRVPRYVGHNPLGGWMVVILLAAVAATTVTGLFSAGRDGVAGPFAPPGGRGLSDWHEVLGSLVIVLVVIHVCGVLVDILLTGENLVRAMFTGRKDLDEAAAALERPLVSGRRAVVPLIVAAAVGGYLLSLIDFGGAGTGGGD